MQPNSDPGAADSAPRRAGPPMRSGFQETLSRIRPKSSSAESQSGALVAGRPHRLRKYQSAIDIVAALALTAIDIAGLWLYKIPNYPLHTPDARGVLLVCTISLPVAVRRRFPLPVAIVSAAAWMATGFFMYGSVVGMVAVLIAIYTVGAYSRMVPGLVFVTALVGTSMGYAMLNPELMAAVDIKFDLVVALSSTIVPFYGAWIVGRAMGARRIYLDELEAHAERLAAANAAEVRAALAEERTRVARELHDVVAHHVSVMTVQAAAAQRTLARSPDTARGAMHAVEETGRSALSEMRRIVGALREASDGSDDDYAPQAGIAELGVLLDRSRDAGLKVDLTISGPPRALPKAIDVAVFRVVQESLTNTLRHAGPTRASIFLSYEKNEIKVQVVDAGGRSPARPGEPVSGHGLIGMRERIALNGGTLQHGPTPEGGFRVEARIPLPAEEA